LRVEIAHLLVHGVLECTVALHLGLDGGLYGLTFSLEVVHQLLDALDPVEKEIELHLGLLVVPLLLQHALPASSQ
jgi:hypothetical protein